MLFKKAVLLIPYAEIQGKITSPFYDYPGFREEAYSWASMIAPNVEWMQVLTKDIPRFTGMFKASTDILYMNFCDGTDVDGYPGVSVPLALEKNGCQFTGAGSEFYTISSSKWLIKEQLMKNGISVPKAIHLKHPDTNTLKGLHLLQYPLICKLACAAEGLGMELHNVANSEPELFAIIKRMFARESHSPLRYGGILIEEYIVGPEYTVLILPNKEKKYISCPAVEIKYVPEVPILERNLFENYKKYPVVSGDKLVERAYYANAEATVQEKLKKVSLDAFIACLGDSYGRVDLRYDGKTAYVLEVNANCSFSKDEPNIVFSANQMGVSIADMFYAICEHSTYRKSICTSGT